MKSARRCPRCGSTNVIPDLSVGSFGSGQVFNRYRCDKCGYAGMFFPEEHKE